MFLVVYTSTYYIFEVSFIARPSALQLTFDTLVDLSFFIDIILTFFQVKENPEPNHYGEIVTDQKGLFLETHTEMNKCEMEGDEDLFLGDKSVSIAKLLEEQEVK